ncbi:MAG: flagellar export protein FliJ [Planctomycetota bacterium]|jgi:flagellar export protein FliJ
MRRFRFRLAPVLRLRAQLERTARRELATAMGTLASVDQKLAAAAAGLRDCADQASRADGVGQLAKGLEQGLRRHHWRLQKQRAEAQQRLDVVRADYTQKARDLKALQKLRDQQREAWRLETQRAEQAELDELAAMARSVKAIREQAAERQTQEVC